MEYNPITDGLLKAFRLIAEQQARQSRGPKRRKFDIEKAGTAIHMAHCVGQAGRDEITALLKSFHAEKDTSKKQELLSQLRKYPVSYVPVYRASTIDYSRYPGHILREIRANGGGAKEKARAMRRAKVSVTEPKLAAAE